MTLATFHPGFHWRNLSASWGSLCVWNFHFFPNQQTSGRSEEASLPPLPPCGELQREKHESRPDSWCHSDQAQGKPGSVLPGAGAGGGDGPEIEEGGRKGWSQAACAPTPTSLR